MQRQHLNGGGTHPLKLGAADHAHSTRYCEK